MSAGEQVGEPMPAWAARKGDEDPVKVTSWERAGLRPDLPYKSGYSAWMSPSNNLQ